MTCVGLEHQVLLYASYRRDSWLVGSADSCLVCEMEGRMR